MKKRMNQKELSQFYHDLALFAQSGLSLERGLNTLKKGKKGFVFLMMDGLQHHIAQGGTLWEGMSGYPTFFNEFQVMLIKAAEASGQLPKTCKALSRYFETRYKEKRRLLGSVIYPVLLLHGVIMLPNLKYLVVSTLDKSYWEVILPPLLIGYGLLALVYVAWKTFFQTGPGRAAFDEILLKLPGFGKLARGMSMARVFRSLSSLHNAGVEPVRTARQASLTAGNAAVTLRLSSALPVLEQGGTFADYFSFAGVLTSNQLSAITVGEETGTLAESLERMTIQLEEDNKQRLSTAIKTIAYAVYFIAAAIVALTVISFYGNYFKVL